jgi:peptidoglycan/LPS O-acetylase OafA/YrhL
MLRALAAIMVVLHHVQLNLALGFDLPNALPNLSVGSAGVDIFFGISGFVMVISSDRLFGQPGAARTFIIRRLIRIVPLYWAVTTLYVVSLGGGYTLAHTAASYLFLPHPAPGGVMQPIHVVGWTLNYEMFFYALFAMAIALPRRLAVGVLIAAMIGLVTVGRVIPPSNDILTFWTRPIMLNFGFGLGLGLAYREGIRLPRSIACAMMAMAAYLFWSQIGQPFPSSWDRVTAYGLPSALLLAGATLGRFGAMPRGARGVALVGDASYALYLLHPLALWGCRMVAIRLKLPVETAPWTYAAFATAASIALSLMAYRLFDRPVTGWLRHRLISRPAPAASSITGTVSLPQAGFDAAALQPAPTVPPTHP